VPGRYTPLLTRWSSRIEKTDGCWIWLGWKDAKQYGRIQHQNRKLLAHRVGYELLVGPIPTGLTIDHLCRNTSCVNPAHLEPVSIAENLRRGAAVITHCPAGHEYNAKNTYVGHKNKRQCRACNRERMRRVNARAA
jgi:hypothetical protein